MDFYTVVLRQSASYWVTLCLENGLVSQGNTQDDAIAKLKEAIESLQEVYESQEDIYNAPVPVKELHEFLTL
jgi:predicted RNase H-like HicB family nuclease